MKERMILALQRRMKKENVEYVCLTLTTGAIIRCKVIEFMIGDGYIEVEREYEGDTKTALISIDHVMMIGFKDE